jgi:hypothetical protein
MFAGEVSLRTYAHIPSAEALPRSRVRRRSRGMACSGVGAGARGAWDSGVNREHSACCWGTPSAPSVAGGPGIARVASGEGGR